MKEDKINDIRNKLIQLELDNKSSTGIFTSLRSDTETKDAVLNKTKFLDSEFPDCVMGQRLYHIKLNLFDIPRCLCNKAKKFYRISNGYHETCGSSKCKREIKIKKFKNTMKKKYPDGYFIEGSKERNRYKKTMLERYGVDHNFKSEEIKNDIKETMITRYGKPHPLSNKDLSNKRNESILSKYGTLNMFSLEKTKNTIKEKYGIDNVMKNSEISEKVKQSSSLTKRNLLKDKLKKFSIKLIEYNTYRSKFVCNRCNSEFNNHPVTINKKLRENIDPCIVCNPPDLQRSQMEKDLGKFISDNYNGIIEYNYKEIFKENKKYNEVDIYLPELNIAFEFNGIYWHSELYKDPDYHQQKTEFLESIGISLIHIWEDTWLNKNEIIKSRILSIIGKSKKIYGRKCIPSIITQKEYKEFCILNHSKGYAPATFPIALLYGGKIISVMSFSNTRKLIESKYSKYDFELIRSCTLMGHSVIGGNSKLLKYFRKHITKKPTSIITYCDRSFSPISENTAYHKIGFSLIKKTTPGFHWVDSGIRLNRLLFTKKKLVKLGFSKDKTANEIMNDEGYYKIWDAGNFKYDINL